MRAIVSCSGCKRKLGVETSIYPDDIPRGADPAVFEREKLAELEQQVRSLGCAAHKGVELKADE